MADGPGARWPPAAADRALVDAVRRELAAAADPAKAPAMQAHRTSMAALPLYRELITTGAWWDLVDSVATDPLAELLAGRDFFIRKAIGWALRAYAWTDPDEVAGYVRANQQRLSALSRREAPRNLGGGPRSR
jgi:3-methyladenine DNA glycosylase AlkD